MARSWKHLGTKAKWGVHSIALMVLALVTAEVELVRAACPGPIPVTHTFTWVEGKYYIVAPPLCPNPNGNPVITDAKTLEAAIKAQYQA